MQVDKSYTTPQEQFWAGEFGDTYIQRNQGGQLLASNLRLFGQALRTTHSVGSCIEFGSNVGMNLQALQLLKPDMAIHAIEINANAVVELEKILPRQAIHHTSILDYVPAALHDLVLIKGVLIHIQPGRLHEVYDKLVASCAKYLLVVEYYNPTPIAVSYRGHEDRLFKRDFAGEIMQRHPNMSLQDYGFMYRGDPNFPQDDITWFLLRKD